MPGFPDKFMPVLDEPPGAKLSTAAAAAYGKTVRLLRSKTEQAMESEPKWRRPGPDLLSGAQRTW
jgi:hydrogenase small subunit